MALKGYVQKDEFYRIVDNKLESLGITEDRYPLDSFKIAAAFKDKLEIDLQPFPSLRLGGLLYKDPEDKLSIMGINSNKPKKGQNFDCMHELCHYWFHPPGEHLCYDSNFIYQHKTIEWQANEGAAQALMPEVLFKKKYIYYAGNIVRLSDFFVTSITSVKYRIENLKLPDVSKMRGMLYKSKKALHCTVCGSTEIKYTDYFCKICGTDGCFSGTSYKWSTYHPGPDIKNKCPECGLKLDNNARFCKRCGTTSTANWLLEPWYVELIFWEDSFMCL